MTLDDWIEKYNKKAPEKFVRDKRYELFYVPDRGFAEIGQTSDMIIINQLCGDARFFKDKVDEVARKVGIKHCGTWCIRRNIVAYLRLFGYRVTHTEKLSDGLKRYECIDKHGRRGYASPAFQYKGGQQAYLVTWEP